MNISKHKLVIIKRDHRKPIVVKRNRKNKTK